MNKALIAIDRSKSFRVYLTISTDLVQEAAKIHDTTPLASAGLGRVLTAAGLMGIMLKDDDNKLTLHFKGDGPARQILATAYGDGRVKGYISNPYVDLPLNDQGKLDVGGSLGVGDLTVIKDLGLKEPYTGTIALVDGEIADDLTAYFYISEQQNSSVALGVKVERDLSIGAAGGMIIQMLPDAQEGAVDALEKMIGAMPPLTTLISGLSGSFDPEIDRPAEAASADDSGQPAGKTLQADDSGQPAGETLQADAENQEASERLAALLQEIFKDVPEEYQPEILAEREIRWECDCSRERIESALLTIGRRDLTEIIEEDGEAELQCQFCCKKYHFNKDELVAILDRMG
ncbi:MAG: Hsp33 family molecular chaperone HslO [Clostridia bacterium]